MLPKVEVSVAPANANAQIFLGDVAQNCNEAEWARSHFEKSAVMLRETGDGDINFIAYSIRRLAQMSWREGDYEKAFTLCKESLELNQEAGDPRGVIACLAGFAASSVAQGKFERSATLMAAVETQLTTIGKLLHMDEAEYDRNLALLKTQLDGKIFAKCWAKGKAMTLERAIGFALQDAPE